MTTKERERTIMRLVYRAYRELEREGIVYIEDVAQFVGCSVDAAWTAAERLGFSVWEYDYAYRVTSWKPLD